MSVMELELSEEEKAQLMASLALGMSESTISKRSSTKSISEKKEKRTFIGPPVPVHRDGMGRFKPKPGEKPLSMVDEPTPGPNNYNPSYRQVWKKYPEYTLREAAPRPRITRRKPAPNKYDTSRSLVWGRCKTITFKKQLKSKTMVTGEASPGPAAHSAGKSSIGGASYSMRAKLNNAYMPGAISSLAAVPDPLTPGPSYRPSDDEWLQRPQTFGSLPAKSKKKIKYPGPDTYGPGPHANTTPKWHIGLPFKEKKLEETPAPNAYKQPRPAKGVSFSMRHRIPMPGRKDTIPGPDVYNKAGFSLDEPGFTLQYRWFDRKPESFPGPGQYNQKDDLIAKKAPAFSFKSPWPSERATGGPGPGQYDVAAPPLDKGRSIGRKMEANETETPSPALYCPEKSKVSLRNAPAYSLASRWKDRNVCLLDETPGPNAYNIARQLTDKPAKTFGLRLKRTGTTHGPGPAQETIADVLPGQRASGRCDQLRGASLSSRHTPNKYEGLAGINKVTNPPKDVPMPPLIG